MSSNEINNLKKRIDSKTSRAIKDTALYIQATAKLIIKNSPRGGRVYGSHKASAPGEPPATDTGNLINSIQTIEIGKDHMRVHVGAEYGHMLEYGTRKMAPRPYFRPAVKLGRKFFNRRLNATGKN